MQFLSPTWWLGNHSFKLHSTVCALCSIVYVCLFVLIARYSLRPQFAWCLFVSWHPWLTKHSWCNPLVQNAILALLWFFSPTLHSDWLMTKCYLGKDQGPRGNAVQCSCNHFQYSVRSAIMGLYPGLPTCVKNILKINHSNFYLSLLIVHLHLSRAYLWRGRSYTVVTWHCK